MRYLLDPGHGGTDGGAFGIEAEINLQICLILKMFLKDLGHEVKLTREADVYVSLERRCQIEEEFQPDLTVSVHCNSFSTDKPTGFEVWTSPGETDADGAAFTLLTSLIHTFPDHNVRVDFSDGDVDKEGELYVLIHTRGPAVLVELGFLSNPDERRFLENSSNYPLISSALAAGILAWQRRR